MKKAFLSVKTLTAAGNIWVAILTMSGKPESMLDAAARPLAALACVWLAVAILRQEEDEHE